MNTILNTAEKDALLMRIAALTGDEAASWGKMNVAQMMEHCIRFEEMMAGQRKIKRVWLGYLVGKMALKGMIGDNQPVKHHVPTLPELVVEETNEDFAQQKEKWIGLLNAYEYAPATRYIHPFFGKMTRDETGRMVFKHTDHHLRQFGR